MRVTDATLDTAVLRMFRDYHITRADGRLSLKSMEADWPALHFRRDDLYDALERLEAGGALRPEVQPEGLVFVLTEQGAQRITEIPLEVNDVLQRLGSALLLTVADRRQPSPPGTPHNRRRGDQRIAA